MKPVLFDNGIISTINDSLPLMPYLLDIVVDPLWGIFFDHEATIRQNSKHNKVVEYRMSVDS